MLKILASDTHFIIAEWKIILINLWHLSLKKLKYNKIRNLSYHVFKLNYENFRIQFPKFANLDFGDYFGSDASLYCHRLQLFGTLWVDKRWYK